MTATSFVFASFLAMMAAVVLMFSASLLYDYFVDRKVYRSHIDLHRAEDIKPRLELCPDNVHDWETTVDGVHECLSCGLEMSGGEYLIRNKLIADPIPPGYFPHLSTVMVNNCTILETTPDDN